jgi:thiol:disulfide interchange protein DsbD
MRGLLFSIIALLGFTAFGQAEEFVTWSSSSKSLGDEEFEITIKAELAETWHTYSQFMDMGGPLPTWITFETGEDFELIGVAEESETTTYYEEVFEVDVVQFDGEAVFIQKVKRLNPDAASITGNVNYQICTDVDGKCIGPVDYTFTLDLASGAEDKEANILVADSTAQFIIPNPANLNLSAPINDCGGSGIEEDDKKSYWVILLLGLGGGLVSLITPCVFPMIPLTVSFFTKGGKDKSGIAKALLYGFSIVLVYVTLSIPFHFGAESEILNNISTNFTLNIIFFVIFVFFAFSFFGYYELTLPSSWANKADKASDVGGVIGIMFMALVLAIVSFSCTGPLLGSVLAGSLTSDFDPWLVTIAMLGFGLGLGLPFTIFAAFPSLLKSLPQSGGWLNTVKVVIGFVELGMALKFLSNADFVYRFGIVHRETFYLIWIVLSILTAIYLFGFIRFPHDSKGEKIGMGRKIIGIVFLAFGIYLSPGVLKLNNQYWSTTLISGFPPSTWYSWYDNNVMHQDEERHEHFTDYYEAVAYAKEHNVPLLLDFTGYACVNCRKMEENVWIQDQVDSLLKDYVVVSLYVDDKVALPEADQKAIDIPLADGGVKTKMLKTVGDKWATFEAIRFGQVAQPFYVLLSPDEYLLNKPVGYTPDATEYSDWLACGLDAFEKLNSGELSASDLEEIETAEEAPIEVEEVITATWSYEVTDLGAGEYEVKMVADLAEGYHTYSQFMDMGVGPYPTWIQYDENTGVEIGEASEIGAYDEYDPVWEGDVTQFAGTATFVQKVKVVGDAPQMLTGKISYQTCNEEQCVLFDEFFEIELK